MGTRQNGMKPGFGLMTVKYGRAVQTCDSTQTNNLILTFSFLWNFCRIVLCMFSFPQSTKPTGSKSQLWQNQTSVLSGWEVWTSERQKPRAPQLFSFSWLYNELPPPLCFNPCLVVSRIIQKTLEQFSINLAGRMWHGSRKNSAQKGESRLLFFLSFFSFFIIVRYISTLLLISKRMIHGLGDI